jgi:TrmH family RNA methyltransferase
MKLDDIKKLHQKKYRQEFGHYLVEGEHLIQELEKVARVNRTFQSARIYLTEQYRDWPTALEKTVVSSRQMAQLSETKNPQGIIAVVPNGAQPLPQVDEAVPAKNMYLFEVQDPGNLGTILRTLAWFGNFRCLLSPNSVDPYNAKVVRSSMGALFHVPLEVEVPLEVVAQRFDRIAYLDMQGKAISSGDFAGFQCYMFGNEARGLPTDHAIFRQATFKQPVAYTIAGSGAIESLNLASAVNMCAYQLSLGRN